jgi:hypothetical protein
MALAVPLTPYFQVISFISYKGGQSCRVSVLVTPPERLAIATNLSHRYLWPTLVIENGFQVAKSI